MSQARQLLRGAAAFFMDHGSLRFMRVPAAMLVIATSAFGQILNGLEWRSIGPAATGGRISDIAVARLPGRPAEIYAGTASGGIFKSVNEGVSWTPIFDRTGGMMSIGAIAVAPSNHGIVWAGTGEANNRQSSSWGDGVYRSTDGGANWRRMGLAETRHIGRIVVHPRNPDVAYVAAAGHLWGSNPERGVFQTTDGGVTWKKVLYRDEHTGAIDLAMDPQDPNVLYAAMYQRQRKGWGFNGGGPGSAIFRSTDGGGSWIELANGLPRGDKGRIGLAISPVNRRVVYAILESEQGGLFRSADGGESWQRLTALNPRPMYYSRVVLDPKDANRVYLLGSNRGLYISDDAGRSFRDVFSGVHGEDHALWVDPDNPNRLIAGGDGGVAISFDRGTSWLFRINMPIGQFYNISANNADPFVVCGGLQDNGSWCTPSATNVSYGVSFKEAFNVGGGDGMYAVFMDDRTLIVSSQSGYAGRLDIETMQRQAIGPIAPAARTPRGQPPYRWYWTTPIAVSHFNPQTIYTGAQMVFRSDDRGASWRQISPDLTADLDREKFHMMGGPVPPRALSRHDGQANFSALTAIAESPLDRNLLYTGADDGTLQRTRDAGQHWNNLTGNIAGLPAMLSISGIVASKHAAGRVYVSVDGHFDDDYRPYVYVSENYGQTWRPIVAGLPQASVRRIREHPANPDVLAVGTEMGLYVSFDRGQHWKTLGDNLPTVPVYDLLFHEKANALVAGTHGRGIWVLDHIEAFGRLTRETLTGDGRLFPIPPARLTATFTGQFWFGAGEFFAPNPPPGAVMSYYLPQGQPGGVRIAIQDAAGKPVRTLLGPGNAGLNRACWDLRRESPLNDSPQPTFATCWPQPRVWGGPLAPPGKYSVALAGGGAAMRSDLVLLPDPRSRISDSERKAHESALASAYALQQQLAPARQAAQTLGGQLAAMRASVPAEVAERVSRELGRVLGQLSNAIAEAARAQNAIDAYEGAPTAEQSREIEWAWEDALAGVAALNRVIRDDMRVLYEAAGPSARWEPLKPVPPPRRATR
jgi:photosystem II stability/assembly factor-like uncharacterized protein